MVSFIACSPKSRGHFVSHCSDSHIVGFWLNIVNFLWARWGISSSPAEAHNVEYCRWTQRKLRQRGKVRGLNCVDDMRSWGLTRSFPHWEINVSNPSHKIVMLNAGVEHEGGSGFLIPAWEFSKLIMVVLIDEGETPSRCCNSGYHDHNRHELRVSGYEWTTSTLSTTSFSRMELIPVCI